LETNDAYAPDDLVDFANIKGQAHVKRVLEIAAAGNHNVRMVGPPGAGKSLLAHAIPKILPPMTLEEALEVTRIYSVSDMLEPGQALVQQRPFHAPHHTISSAGLIGGGSVPKPGGVSLSHRGVLFLDEVNEFPTRVLELLRQPIEDKTVTISRAKQTLTFPANFMLVAAHNPCPCGNFGDSARACSCSPTMIKRYQAKLSEPMLDRIDIHVDVPRVEYDKLMDDSLAEPSEAVRARVIDARERQTARFADRPTIYANGDIGPGDIDTFCVLDADAKQVLELSVRRLQLSARSYHRVLKLSRTIADLDSCDTIGITHVSEALQYRASQFQV
ncbi:MAG: YifB family Mg chelatase-like AAA ATPase, partial [Chloroflexota bacterium]